MNKVLAVLVAGMLSFGAFAAEKQKVCVDVKDAKTGKMTQQCKEMKVHKKLEGTKVPEKK